MESRYDYLIVGGGMVANAAAAAIRERDADGTIGILGEEPTPPFPRPALSKKLWTDPDFSQDDADPDTAGETGADVVVGTRVVGVDPGRHEVRTDNHDTVGYGKLLLATGGRPRQLDGLPAGDRVIYFRTLTDYRRLRELSGDDVEAVVVGGGFIGTEVAAALVQDGCRVTLLHQDDVLGASTFPDELARELEEAFTDAGVQVHGGLEVESGEVDGDRVVLTVSDGSRLEADVVVVGLGIEPSTDPAVPGLDRTDDGGIVVDDHLRTSVHDVWAAGDVAEYPDTILGRRRVEHVDNAESMGTTAGHNLAGSDEVYDHTPMFYSDLFDHGYEAVGTLDSSLETVVDRFGDGSVVVYYLDDEAVQGVLLWDCDGGVDDATALLAEHSRPADGSDLVGRIRPTGGA